MSDDNLSLPEARVQAEVARAELRGALGDALGWFSPTRLKAEAAQVASHQIGEVKTKLRRSVTSHPLIAWPALALIGASIAWLLRAPFMALVQGGTDAVQAVRTHFSTRK